jgi:hypothetical protein
MEGVLTTTLCNSDNPMLDNNMIFILYYTKWRHEMGAKTARAEKSAHRGHRQSASATRGVHDNSVAVGMRAFFNIAEKWGLSPDESIALLGHPSRSTFYNWKNGDVGSIAHSFDLASRISYVLGIFKALEILYQRPELADEWIKRPNKAFGGQSAMDRMQAGHIVDLAAVRDYLDSVRGGW